VKAPRAWPNSSASASSRVAAETDRAGQILGRIRSLVAKSPPRKVAVDLNAIILEVID